MYYDYKYSLPSEVKYCFECVISNQKPITLVETKHLKEKSKQTTFFNKEGVCDACNWSKIKKNEIDWEEREKELINLLDSTEVKMVIMIVIVPSSGGKKTTICGTYFKRKIQYESAYCYLGSTYSLKGKKNFYNMINAGFDNILITPNGKVIDY